MVNVPLSTFGAHRDSRPPFVGRAILPADPLSSGSSRLKGGCRQDWRPHTGYSSECQVRHRRRSGNNLTKIAPAMNPPTWANQATPPPV
jgi:hypothetical protein